MTKQSGILGALVAQIKGEVPADTLEAYRRAGQSVYDLLKQVEDRRLDLKIQGLNPWTVDPATQALFLCAWNAFVLQTVADRLLEADYQADRATVGYVPPITAEQALAFYSQVESWLSQAHQAQNNPVYRLEINLPADLPSWHEDPSCPNTHLDGMVSATRLIRTHAEVALAAFEAETIPADRQSAVQKLHQRLAAANSAAEYAEQLWAPDIAQAVHPKIERHAKAALEQYYSLGQLLAMPQLLEHPLISEAPTIAAQPGQKRPMPGQAGFDPWCLTDPAIRDVFQQDPDARAAIAELWRKDPEPFKTVAIQTEIDAALALGHIAYATDRWEARLGNYYCCPWAPIYVVKHPVAIGNQPLNPEQEFTFEVSAMNLSDGGAFKRHILIGIFHPTDETCLPRSKDHHRTHRRHGC